MDMDAPHQLSMHSEYFSRHVYIAIKKYLKKHVPLVQVEHF